MKPKQALIVFAAVALLVGAIAVNELWLSSPEKDKEMSERLFPGLEADGLDKVSIVDGATETVLEKKDGKWAVPGDHPYPADQERVSKLLEKLAGLKSVSLVSENKKNHERLGVGDLGVKVTLKSGEETRANLIVGNEGKNPATCFVRLSGEDKVHLVAEDLTFALVGRGGDWRDKTIFDEPMDQVKEIALREAPEEAETAPGGTASGADTAPAEGDTAGKAAENMPEYVETVLKRNAETKAWTMVVDGETLEPERTRVDSTARALTTLKSAEFDDEFSMADAGLDPPRKTAVLTMEDGTSHVLYVGYSDGSKYFVTRPDSGVIQKVSRYNIENIFKSRDKFMGKDDPGTPGGPPDFSDPSSMLPPPGLDDFPVEIDGGTE